MTNTYVVIFSVVAFVAACSGRSRIEMMDARGIAPTDANDLAVDALLDGLQPAPVDTPDSAPDLSTSDIDTRANSAPDARAIPVVTTSPWPESCLPPDTIRQPADEEFLKGPAGSMYFGELAGPGEVMTAKLNGYLRSFDRFQTKPGGLVGYGYNGSIELTLPSFAVGTYACPAARIFYSNLAAGSRDSNSASSRSCCTIQIARSGAVGEIVEGTFSGILIHDAINAWIKVEDGHFAVIRR